MRSDEDDSVTSSGSARTLLFSGPDISTQVKQLEQRIAQQACKDLTLAAASGKTSDVTRTIELGAEVDTTVNGYTPLMRAANWGHVDTLAALIAEGGDMFATDRQGRTALDWSRIARRDKAARVLERAMENEIRYRREATKAVRGKRELWAVVLANARHTRDVAKAVDTRDLREIKRIVDRAKLSRHEFLSACDRLGFRNADEASRRASESGYGGGVDIGPESRKSVSGTSENTAEEVVELEAVAAPVTTTLGGVTEAVGNNEPVTLNTIPSAIEENGASMLGAVPVFFLDAEGRGGTTALALATVENDADMVRRLVKEGADPGVEASTGHTALTWAATCGFDLIAAELLIGSNTKSSGSGGGSRDAATPGSVDAAIDAVTKSTVAEGRTALHSAAFNGNSGVIVLLLDRLRDLLLTDGFGKQRKIGDETGPGKGWFYPFRDFVRRKDHQGSTARDLAGQGGYDEVGTLLDNAEGRIEVWEAGERAVEYASQRVECGNDGCRHRDRRDRIERHERTECQRRPAGCPACGKKLAAGDLQQHDERECEKRSDACPNAFLGCFDVMPHERIASHIAHTCKFRNVDCRRGCGASVIAHQLDVHEQEHCRLSKHPCVFGCGEKITKAEMGAHIKKDCSKRKIRCRVGCGSDIEAGKLQHHEQEVCTQPCCWEGCGERLGPALRRAVHERSLCPERPAECIHGCGVRGLTAALKDTHAMHHCQLRPVPCPHGCGACLPNNELPAHVRGEGGTCPERLQRCRLDCLRRRILVPLKDTFKSTRGSTTASGTPAVTTKNDADGKGDADGSKHGAEKNEGAGVGVGEKAPNEDRGGEPVQLVPGMLRSYDASTGLFGIRYSFGNRQQALEDLDFVWADQGGGSSAWACGWIPATDMPDHLLHSCPLRSTPCRDGCGQSLVVREADRHYRDHCPKRFVVCPLGCRAEVRQENLGKHLDDVCPLRRSPCESCGVPLPLDSHARHLAESCVRVPRRCTNGCGAHILGEDLQHHLSTECPKRIVPCPLGCPESQLWAEEVTAHVRDSCPLQMGPCRKGCGKQVAVCFREEHEARECSERIVTCECGMEHAFSETEDHRITACLAVVCYCSLGCGVKVRKMDMDLHQEEQCERKTLRTLSKMIECPLGCGHLILRQWEFQHRTFDCPKRPARCPAGCSADVTADEAATHFMTCGRRRIRCGAESTSCERMLLTWVGQTEASLKRRLGENIPTPGQEGSRFQKDEEGLVACSDHGSDAIMWAAGKGDSELPLLEELISLSGAASINRESHHGDTALTIACSRGHVETVRTLVKVGHADVNHETLAGKTPLIEAARHGRTAVVRVLMELRAVIPYTNRRGQTAAWWAKRLGHQDCVLPMMREVKAEATLRLMSSQIARGDVNAVRSLVELGEPYRDNHSEQLESQIGRVTKELDAASKKLRDLSALKEQLCPGLERLKASLAADLAQRRKIQREAARSARAGGGGGATAASTRGPGPRAAAVSSRSFQAMKSRALRLFQRSVSRFQVLTDNDFKTVAGLNLLHPDTASKDASEKGEDHGDDLEAPREAESPASEIVAGKAAPEAEEEETTRSISSNGTSSDDANESKDREGVAAEEKKAGDAEGSNPTPSLSARSTSSSSSHRRHRRLSLDHRPDERMEGGGQLDDLASLSPSSDTLSATEAAAILRMLRATVLMLGGCGLGALPSDKELWEAVKPMLLDGSFKQRVRHFDRRRVPEEVLDAVRALLNIGVGDDDENDPCTHGAGSRHRDQVGQTDANPQPPRSWRAAGRSTDAFCSAGDTSGRDFAALSIEGSEDGEATICTAAATIDGNRTARNSGALLGIPGIGKVSENDHGGDSDNANSNSITLGGKHDTRSKASTSTDDDDGRTDEGDSEQDDGPDPWGDGRGESSWGQRISTSSADDGGGGGGSDGGGGGGFALVQALGAWCASVSAYDRLVHLAPGSAARKAAEAETEWDELERRIARLALDVQLEEFSLQVLSKEIEKATTSAEYLSQKRAWSEDRLGVARLMSLFSPAGHSLVSWAAACGQTEVVEILMNHGATAELGDDTRAVSASIIQTFYRFRRYARQASPQPKPVVATVISPSATVQSRSPNASVLDCGDSDGGDQATAVTASSAETGGGAVAARQAEERRAYLRRRMEYMIGMVGRHATLARLRKSRRLPLTEAAYNGHYEVLQYFRLRRTPLYGASRTWLYPSAPPPFAPLGDGTTANYVLESPMSVSDCAEAGTRDRGCKQRIPGRGWVGESDAENRFAVTERIAGAVWREITTVAAMGREEKGRRRALRIKMRKQETLLRSMDAAIEEGYPRAPEIVALCQEGASIDRETDSGKTALISAAEEDPQALGHEWVKNEEGWEVLATALLLDRRIHRPKIDYESKVTGHTALTRACVLGRVETAEVLLDRGADINRLPKRRPVTPQQPALHQKPRQQSPAGGRPSSPSPTAITPAPARQMAAAAGGGTAVSERFRQTPLVAAAAAGHAAMVKLLLERGADPEVRDGNGETAADVAMRGAFVDVLGELARREAGNLGTAAGERGAANPLVPCGWGCGKLVATGHLKTQHEQECAHREVECKYACGTYRLQQRQLERHLAESCRLRPVVCSTRCGVSVVAEDYANHQATACAMRPVVCKACKNKVVASALSRHETETCPMRMVECEQGCGEEVPVSGLAHHLKKTCPLMRVKCRLGCGLSMQLKMLTEHERSLCSERLVECRWRCLKGVKAKHIDIHEKLECPRADAPCGNRCGLYLPLGDMKRHYADSCAHRFVPCGLGCGYRVRAKDLAQHEHAECEARLVSCPAGCNGDGGGEDKRGGDLTAKGAMALFPARALDVHLKFGCAFRSVKCATCGDKVKAIELDAHKQETCRRRPVACRNKGCCLQLPAEDMTVHEQTECSRRRVWCLQGCGEEMRADERRRHHTTACSMRYLPCPLGCPKKVRVSEADDHVDFFCVRRHLA